MRCFPVLLLIAALLLPTFGGLAMPPAQLAAQPVSLAQYWEQVGQTRQAVSSLKGQPAAQPVSLAQYWEQVGQTRQAVSSLQGQPAASIRSQLDRLAGEWGAITQVKLPDGTLLPIDTGGLQALLHQDPPDIALILARLDALQQLHADFPNGKYSQKELDALAKVLSDPRFQSAKSNSAPVPPWLLNIWNKIQDWLDRLFGNPSGSASTFFLLGEKILIWVLAILLGGILVYAGRGLWINLVGEVELGDEGLSGEEPLSSDAAFQRADFLSMGGNFRSAVRYLYLSALLLLDERGLLRYDRSRTNREVLRSVSATPALANPLRAVIDIFDRVWYGFESIDQATYQEYVEQVGLLRKHKP